MDRKPKPGWKLWHPPEQRTRTTLIPRWTGLRGKTVWDWLLLISALAVPVVVGFAGLWFTQQQEARQQDIEDQRSQDTALQAYLDNMSTLLIDEQGTQLRKLDPDKEVLDLIQARTETVFAELDTKRQVSIVRFLARAQLILKDSPVISLERVNLQDIDLTDLNLSDTSFEAADLSDGQFSGANLKGANFRDADLSGATLLSADLRDADLQAANLSKAALQGADLSNAVLQDANLSNAALQDANLTNAVLTDADLSEARGWTTEQLSAARSLEGATMPNGQKYEDWLKD